MSELDQIVETLERNEQPATYGAVGGIVCVHYKVVMSGRPRNHRNSWVVNKKTRVPTKRLSRNLSHSWQWLMTND